MTNISVCRRSSGPQVSSDEISGAQKGAGCRKARRILPLLTACCPLFWFGVCDAAAATYRPWAVSVPKPRRELRGAWIATVSNIDWPSTNNLSTAQQKAELLAMLDRAAEMKLNTIIFQVRPACDALYASTLEPWSEYLTGTMGQAPEPFYDPLAFAVEEAHKRGLELHAWFNPYRARHANSRAPISAGHIIRTKPQLVKQYGKSLWLDPGEKEVQAYSLAVILDVVRRYDIDGVHIDDYFYPYKERDGSGRELEFPDEKSWQRFGAGGKLSRDEWRRENVNVFVHRVYDAVRTEKKWVKFGVSPFGIWRPGNPPQIQGFDAYEKLYADSRKWLTAGWVDYFAPQLYWSIDAPEQSFPVLLDWWASQNPLRCLITPGMDSTKVPRKWAASEILNQIGVSRKQAGVAGHLHWNMRALMRSAGLSSALQTDVYSEPALVPQAPRLAGPGPAKPICTARVRGREVEIRWQPATGQSAPWQWVMQTKRGSEWRSEIFPGGTTARTFSGSLPQLIAVAGIDRAGNLGSYGGLQRKD